MFIYSQEPLSSNESRARQLYITYFQNDCKTVEPILNALSTRGTTYTCMVRGKEECSRDDYVKKVSDIIKACRVGIVMLSKSTFSQENEELQQLLWYEIGSMVSNGVKIVLFFLDIERSERNNYLATTPVRQMQGTDNIDDLVALLDSMHVEEKIFYTDPLLNKYASKRISYVKLTSLFNVFKSDLHEIYNYLQEIDDEIDDENELLNELLTEMKCGCTVMRFNDETVLGVEVEPYFPEVHTILRDYPIKQNYIKPTLISSSTSPDIYATVRAEFILPVHSLLGVTFKPYISINRISKFKTDHIKKIILSNANNAAENRDISVVKADKEQRVYFLFELDTAQSGEEFAKFGEKMNHLWPA